MTDDDENARVINALKNPRFWLDYGKQAVGKAVDLIKTPGERLKGGDPTLGLSEESIERNIKPSIGIAGFGPAASAPFALRGSVDPNVVAALFLRKKQDDPRLAQLLNKRNASLFEMVDDKTNKKVGDLVSTYFPDSGHIRINGVASEQGPNSLGLSNIRDVLRGLLKEYPDANKISGYRGTGARGRHDVSGNAEMIVNRKP